MVKRSRRSRARQVFDSQRYAQLRRAWTAWSSTARLRRLARLRALARARALAARMAARRTQGGRFYKAYKNNKKK